MNHGSKVRAIFNYYERRFITDKNCSKLLRLIIPVSRFLFFDANIKEVRESCDVSSGFINFLKKVFVFFFVDQLSLVWSPPLHYFQLLISLISRLHWPCKAIFIIIIIFFLYSNSNFFPSSRFIGCLISQKNVRRRCHFLLLSRRVIILPMVEIWSNLLSTCLL